MKGKDIFIIGLLLAAAGGYYYYNQIKTAAASITGRIYGVSFDWLQTRNSLFTRIFFNVQILVNNPGAATMTVNAVNLNVYFNKNFLVSVNRTEPVTIPPGGGAKINLLAYVPTLSIFRDITAAYQSISNKEKITFDLIGGVTVPGGVIKINESKTLEIA